MRRELVRSFVAVVVFTVLLGLLYPLGVWAVGQIAFPGRAGGSQVKVHGRVVGSRLLGQDFAKRPGYFQSRPSADDDNPAGTFFANRGPNQRATVYFYRRELRAYLKRERPYDPSLTTHRVPVDAVTASASGVDPGISPANAAIQAHRIAAVRRLPLARVRRLIDEHTDGRSVGFLGEPGVNVLELNLALDREAPLP
ncbi:MAG TPA: K(+)-transporting ATPase subunit C [Solirubrobacteraceae bacterium]